MVRAVADRQVRCNLEPTLSQSIDLRQLSMEPIIDDEVRFRWRNCSQDSGGLHGISRITKMSFNSWFVKNLCVSGDI